METPASVAKHPIHAMLVPIPTGLFLAALVFDLAYLVTGRSDWSVIAFWDIAAGLAGALLAAVPGLIDYLWLRQPARRVGTWHMAINLTVVAVFAANLLARTEAGRAVLGPGSEVPLTLTVVGVALLLVSGWLGGEMVYRHRVGVEEPLQRLTRHDRRVA
ncbi:MAG: DUF2231 domain-containing protein [Candidatus Rokuibacteriota bacterium]